MFLIKPARLREVLGIDQAHYLHLGDHPAFCDPLPQWLLEDLFETIGPHEEPLDEPVVTIDDVGKLRLPARRA